MKRLLLCVFIAACASAARAADTPPAAPLPRPPQSGVPWTGAEISKLRAQVDQLLRSPALRGAHVGLLASDAGTQALLYSRAADEDFVPASNLKLVTGSTALARLGTGFTFETTLASSGTLGGDAIDGDLVLRGGGDALLRAADLDAAAATLAQRGIRTIRGNLVLDTSYFDGPSYQRGWTWDDFPYYYAPLVSALALEENTIHLTVSPGAAPGASAAIAATPQTSAFTIENDVLTGTSDAKDTVDIERTAEGNIRMFGILPLGGAPDAIDAAVPDPVAYAGDVFRRALAAHGISLKGGLVRGITPPGATTLWTHDSGPLPQILSEFWHESDNLVGEMLLKSLAVARAGAPGTTEPGIELEQEYLRGIGVDTATITIADGSGLSIYNLVTPRALVTLLLADWQSPYRDIMIDALPLAGVRGSLKSAYLGTPAQGRVFAKTGTMTHVSTLSGYIATRRHGTVVFSFMLGDALGDPVAFADLFGKVLSRFVIG